MSTSTVGTMPDMTSARAWWAEQQAAFLAEYAKTHDFDFCPLHGFWRLGPKMGGLFVATCPPCSAAERLYAELHPDPFAIDDEDTTIEILSDGTIIGGGVPRILTQRAAMGGDY